MDFTLMFHTILISLLCLLLVACGSGGESNETASETLDVDFELSGLEGEVTVANITSEEVWTFTENGKTSAKVKKDDELQIINSPTLQNCLFSGLYSVTTLTEDSTVNLECGKHLFFTLIDKEEHGFTSSLWVSNGRDLKNVAENLPYYFGKNYFQKNGFAYYRGEGGVVWETDGTLEGTELLTFPGVSAITSIRTFEALPEKLFLIGQDNEDNEKLYFFDIEANQLEAVSFPDGEDISYLSQDLRDTIYTVQYVNKTLTISVLYRFPDEFSIHGYQAELPKKYLTYYHDNDYGVDPRFSELTIFDKTINSSERILSWPISTENIKRITIVETNTVNTLVGFTIEDSNNAECIITYLLTEDEKWNPFRDDCNASDGFNYSFDKNSVDGAITFRYDGDELYDIGLYNLENHQFTTVVTNEILQDSLYEVTYYDDGVLLTTGINVSTEVAPFSSGIQQTVWFYGYKTKQLNMLAEGRPTSYSIYQNFPTTSLYFIGQEFDAHILNLKFFTLPTDETGWEIWVTDGTQENTYPLDFVKPGSESGVKFFFDWD